MKRAFVRGLWGDFWSNDRGITDRKDKICRDIERVKDSPYEMDFVTYIFGTDNIPLMEKYDLPYVLVDERSIVWDMKRELYRHKLEIFKRSMEDYDQIVYLDWDCILTSPLPENVWDILEKRDVFQANLFLYRTKKCLWRDVDVRKTCNGGFVYLADKSIPDHFIKNWVELGEWASAKEKERQARGLELRLRERSLLFDDEPSISKYVDDYCGKWPGLDGYWDRFEPQICNLRKKSAFTKEQNESKNACFTHML
jgi:hypothetical protein